MSIVSTLETDLGDAFAQLKHAALWLVGHEADIQRDITAIESADPAIATAIKVGEAAAAAEGIPVVAITNAAETVLSIAQQITAAQGTTTTSTTTTTVAPGIAASVPGAAS